MKMKSLKRLNCLLCVAVSALVLAGCESKMEDSSISKREVQEDEELNQDSTEEELRSRDTTEEETESRDGTEEKAPVIPDAPEHGEESEEKSPEQKEAEALLRELSNREFYFSSGAGGWGTTMSIGKGGTFEGVYQDSDMGDIGEGYPNGVVYLCNFIGKFSQPQKVNDYTYSMKIEHIENKKAAGTEEIIDGTRYCYSEPYGLESAEEIYIYLPGSPIKELPEGFRSWTGYYDLGSIPDTGLPYYGLYNVAEEYGFSSSVVTGTETDIETGIEAELAAIEAEATALEEKLQSGMLNQMQLNQTSAELYQLWDDELNSIWGRLKEKLDSSTMAALTEEERAWISEKEREVEAVGAEYGAGTMRPLVENEKATEMTRARVYELAELLR